MPPTKTPLVGVVMGSDSDLGVMDRCIRRLSAFGIPHEVRIISAHRTPDLVHEYAGSAASRGVKVIIAAAGMSAALAGMIAAKTPLPVIGVPLSSGPLVGIDAALSTLQMPAGLPVGTMALSSTGATNAAIYAAQILATSDETLLAKLEKFKTELASKVQKKDEALQTRR
jgi:phosphoribosylaminoimidazole carboxylase PurE protein